MQVICICPRNACRRAFIANYQRGVVCTIGFPADFTLTNVEPYIVEAPNIPKELIDLSPNFEEIYSQAYLAEKYDLNQIAGVGYRKALEFLIKPTFRTPPKEKNTLN
jgi:hypothetical protein